MTKTYAVIGDPIAHSLSPLIHNTLYARYRLDCRYIPLQVKQQDVPEFFASTLGSRIAGCNVTMPNKAAVIPHLLDIHEDAALCRSVNTIAADGLKGWSTDAPGLRRAVEQAGFSYKGSTLLLYGAGGAASSIALDFARQGGAALYVCNRTAEKAHALVGFVRENSAIPMAGAICDADLPTVLPGCDLFFNTTPLGMSHTGLEFASLDFLGSLPPHALVCDLIYNPFETKLLARAKALGLATLNGLPMLIHQAFLSFEKWFGILPDEADYAAIWQALTSALGV
ncbi:MAG: shikimate dehydrogenase [Christensenellaceae bacterium]|nr:shikimate dehydrogenase [Christensenellaceae bacterium]